MHNLLNNLLNEDGYSDAVNAQDNQLTQSDARVTDGNIVPEDQQMTDQQSLDMMTQPSTNPIDDFIANDTNKNIKLYDLFNSLNEIAHKLKDNINTNISKDMVGIRALHATHEDIIDLNQLISDLNRYIEVIFIETGYQKNLYCYLTFRNALVKIIKNIKKTLDV